MTDKGRKLSCNTRILNEIERQFDHAEETKSKVFFMRYDIRFPEGYTHADNGVFRAFQSKFMKNLSRQGLKPQYIAICHNRWELKKVATQNNLSPAERKMAASIRSILPKPIVYRSKNI